MVAAAVGLHVEIIGGDVLQIIDGKWFVVSGNLGPFRFDIEAVNAVFDVPALRRAGLRPHQRCRTVGGLDFVEVDRSHTRGDGGYGKVVHAVAACHSVGSAEGNVFARTVVGVQSDDKVFVRLGVVADNGAVDCGDRLERAGVGGVCHDTHFECAAFTGLDKVEVQHQRVYRDGTCKCRHDGNDLALRRVSEVQAAGGMVV